jgi:hypothetical protein
MVSLMLELIYLRENDVGICSLGSLLVPRSWLNKLFRGKNSLTLGRDRTASFVPLAVTALFVLSGQLKFFEK